MKTYKIGDTIKIKSLEWYNEHKNDDQGRCFVGGKRFRPAMAIHCGKKAKIIGTLRGDFRIDIDPEYGHLYTIEMFEDS